jgi:Co/Zn/Cd efflux system component
MLVGQLPFETVISRGANLQGLDRLLVPTAQASFNMMVVGAIIGVVVGVVLARLLAGRSGA